MTGAAVVIQYPLPACGRCDAMTPLLSVSAPKDKIIVDQLPQYRSCVSVTRTKHSKKWSDDKCLYINLIPNQFGLSMNSLKVHPRDEEENHT